MFGYAAEAIGLDVREQKFALAVMNDAEPSPSDVATFERDLKDATGARAASTIPRRASRRWRGWSPSPRQSGVPVVGVTETEPPNQRYQDWVKGELDALDKRARRRIN